jgi:hypothetical protein
MHALYRLQTTNHVFKGRRTGGRGGQPVDCSKGRDAAAAGRTPQDNGGLSLGLFSIIGTYGPHSGPYGLQPQHQTNNSASSIVMSGKLAGASAPELTSVLTR